MIRNRFRSLRYRLLVPLTAAALLASVGVALVSYWLGDREVERRMDQRFATIAATLSRASFPFTPPVLETLSDLTGSELATYGADGRLVHATISDELSQRRATGEGLRRMGRALSRSEPLAAHAIEGFHARSFPREGVRGADDDVAHVVVLFDQLALQRSRWQAASLPLVTGLSTMLVLSAAAWLLTRPLIRRIADLQVDVERIAGGDFDAVSAVADAAGDRRADELTRLGQAVQAMGRELGRLWKAVHQQERQKLIHQLAAGLAHQLRNSLSGARMAVELHARRCRETSSEGLDVALRELERTEEFVQRILMIAADGAKTGEVAGTVAQAVEDVRTGLAAVAQHQRIALQWKLGERVTERSVADIQALTAALQNLVLNGLQAGGDRVVVTADCGDGQVEIMVRDNGPGPTGPTGADLFEPFVTSKPEGLGLGLTLVRRAADRLGGSVSWQRENGHTLFRFVAAVVD